MRISAVFLATLICSKSLLADRDELINAVFANETSQAKALLVEGLAVDEPDQRGVTALGLACQNGNAELVELLLAKGAQAQTRSGREPPLLIAARTGSVACVKMLLAAGAKIDESGRGSQTPLMWAAAAGHQEVVSLLIAKGADTEKTLDTGFDALLFAVRGGHRDVVVELLESGLAVDKAYNPKRGGGGNMRGGTSPMMLAVENGHLELALELVARGADPNDLRSSYGPLHALTWVRKSVRGDGADGIPPPFIMSELGSLGFVRKLVEAGADVNLQLVNGGGGRGRVHRKGQTPFFMAAASGDLALAKLLLELGADPTLNSADDTTPFLTAVGLGILAPGEEQSLEEDALAMGEFLLTLGADINHVNKNGETAMHGAAYKASPKMMEFLDKEGADIAIWNERNRYGWTPLLIAQGFRPGNFRPIQYSEDALANIMRSHGVEPTKSPPPPRSEEYEE
ncbi:MAG: ankyrin repeat domain-containing protein [Roseibacillus sp.]